MSDHHVRQYLRAIAALALECADRRWLWPIFIEFAKLVPATVRELAGAQPTRRIAG